MRSSIEDSAELVRGRPPRRVFFAEWLDPPFCAGHWVPEMIALAGARDVIGVAATPSRSVTWGEVMGTRSRTGRPRSVRVRRRKRPDEPQVSRSRARRLRLTATATFPGRLLG
jgi:hypothetical protein